MFSEAPPRPRTATSARQTERAPQVRHQGNGYVDGVVPHLRVSTSLQPQALLPAFSHIHSTLTVHRYVANGLMLAMAAVLMICMLIVLWVPPVGYATAGLIVLTGLFIGLTSRFIFTGSCMALLTIALASLVPHLKFFEPDTMATYVFILLSYGMVYLLCENKFSSHTTKDKITTPRGIKNNPIFKRALVRKYQKKALSGFPKS